MEMEVVAFQWPSHYKYFFDAAFIALDFVQIKFHKSLMKID